MKIKNKITGLVVASFLVGCTQAPVMNQHKSTKPTKPTKFTNQTNQTKTTKQIKKVSPHANFASNEGGYCDFENKTILVTLKPNGTGEFLACRDYVIEKDGIVSSGRPGTNDTVRGDFKTAWKAHKWDSKKYPSDVKGQYNMKRAMFFHNGFAIHHGNVNGLSHGCVRTQMSNADWLYDWSPIGTRIIVE